MIPLVAASGSAWAGMYYRQKQKKKRRRRRLAVLLQPVWRKHHERTLASRTIQHVWRTYAANSRAVRAVVMAYTAAAQALADAAIATARLSKPLPLPVCTEWYECTDSPELATRAKQLLLSTYI